MSDDSESVSVAYAVLLGFVTTLNEYSYKLRRGLVSPRCALRARFVLRMHDSSYMNFGSYFFAAGLVTVTIIHVVNVELIV